MLDRVVGFVKRGIGEIERLLGVAHEPRRDTIVETTGVRGIRVRVAPLHNVGWSIDIANERGVALHVCWDDCTYVNTEGYATGRLIHDPVRRPVTVASHHHHHHHDHYTTSYTVDVPEHQAPTAIPASAKLAAYCVPESQIGLVAVGKAVLPAGAGDGVLRIVFDTPDGRETWTGAVTFTDRR